MTKCESLKKIEQIINNNEKCVISLVGRNATFKTELLKDIKNKFSSNNNFNILFLKAETTFSNEMKEKQSDTQFIGEIRKFINSFLSQKVDIIDGQIKDLINKTSSFLNNIKNNNKNDEYLKSEIFNSFKLDDNLIKNKINIEILPNEKNLIKNYSSGQGMYSLLKFCSFVIKESIKNPINNSDNKEKKTLLIIDEPEKHCHKSLIKKIFNIMYQLYDSKIIIIFSTHSDYLLNEFILKFRYVKKNDFYLFNHEKPHNNDASISEIEKIIEKINNKLNIREWKIINSSFFDENIILVEGLKDYEFINNLITSNEDLNHHYYSIYDCEGKRNVVKIFNIIKSLIPNKKIICFVDRDKNNEITDENFFEFIPNIEMEIKDLNPDNKSNVDFYAPDNIKKTILYSEVSNKLIIFFKKEY